MNNLKVFDKYLNINRLSLNTSNPNKLIEFKKYGLNINHTSINLDEPMSDPITIIRYKATKAGENILVEDTNFCIDGTSIGVDIKFRQDEILKHLGSKATFDVWLGILIEKKVYIYRGTTIGKIVTPIPNINGWEFDIYFRPDGSDYTFAQKKDKDNPRYKAVQNLLSNKIYKIERPLYWWNGKFQR